MGPVVGAADGETKFSTYMQLAGAEHERVLQRCRSLEDTLRTSARCSGGGRTESQPFDSEASLAVPRRHVSFIDVLAAPAEVDGAGGLAAETEPDQDQGEGVRPFRDPPTAGQLAASADAPTAWMTSGSDDIVDVSAQVHDCFLSFAGLTPTGAGRLQSVKSDWRIIPAGDPEDHPVNAPVRHIVVAARACLRGLSAILTAVSCLYDMLTVPYIIAWDPPSSTWTQAVSLSICVFWTTDMLLNLFFAYGRPQSSQLQHPAARDTTINYAYVRSWFAVDLAINSVDSSAVFMEMAMQGSGGVPLRILRIVKVNRLVRVMIVAKQNLEAVEAVFANPSLRIAGLLGRLIIIVLLLNHELCCVWFWLGSNGDSGMSDTGLTWLDGLIGADLQYREAGPNFQYWTSLHWCLTQMTPGSMEVFPQNSVERFWNVVCLVIGLCVSSLLMAQLSARMVRILVLDQERMQQSNLLSRFLNENNVPLALKLRIEMQSKHRLNKLKPLTEKEAPLLKMLTGAAHKELLHAIFAKPMVTYTLFLAWDIYTPTFLAQLCVAAIELEVFAADDDVFTQRVGCDTAFWLCEGCLEYTPGKADYGGHEVTPAASSGTMMIVSSEHISSYILGTGEAGPWFSTVALWLNWTYTGAMKACAMSKVVTVRSQDLHSVLSKHPELFLMGRNYAIAFQKVVVKETVAPYADVHVDPAMVLMAMPLEERLTIMGPLLCCLQEQWPKIDMNRLATEVEAGKCVLSLGPKGHVFRIVFVAVLRIARPCGRILVRVARTKGVKGLSQLVPAVALPGGKLFENETEPEFVERILGDEFACIRDSVVLGSSEHTEVFAASRDYGIHTMYKKTVRHATFSGVVVPAVGKGRSSFGKLVDRSSSLRSRLDFPCHDWLVTLHESADDGSVAPVLHAWLLSEELERLVEAPDSDVEQWLVAVQAAAVVEAVVEASPLVHLDAASATLGAASASLAAAGAALGAAGVPGPNDYVFREA